jgi:hypothetical protein
VGTPSDTYVTGLPVADPGIDVLTPTAEFLVLRELT